MKTSCHSHIRTQQETDWIHIWQNNKKQPAWKNNASAAERCSSSSPLPSSPHFGHIFHRNISPPAVCVCDCLVRGGTPRHIHPGDCLQRRLAASIYPWSLIANDIVLSSSDCNQKHVDNLAAYTNTRRLNATRLLWPHFLLITDSSRKPRKHPALYRLLRSFNRSCAFGPNLQLTQPS